MVAESWFRNLWKVPRKPDSGTGKEPVGVLAFEVASLMSKLVHLWQSLSDKQVAKLREDITNSMGIRKLVSDNDELIVHLICSEMIDGMVHLAKSVVRLGKKCSDASLKRFEHMFDELIRVGSDPYGWGFAWKKMDKKVKKMEHFISANASLYQEMELLADLEQMMRRMKSVDPQPDNLLEYQKKLVWKQQEVKNLREMSLWNRTYDYIVMLLARSLYTIFGRIVHVFGINALAYSENSNILNFNNVYRNPSALLQSPMPPSENVSIPRFASGPLGRFAAKLAPSSKSNMTQNFYSGPLRDLSANSHPPYGKKTNGNFFSGPRRKPTTNSGPISGLGMYKSGKKKWQLPHSPIFWRTKLHTKLNTSTEVGHFEGSVSVGNSRADADCHLNSSVVSSGCLHRASTIDCLPQNSAANTGPSIFSSHCKMLNSLPGTLGAAGLALHYANVIIVMEKLAASPHLIGHDARDDLYTMLPASVRTALRHRLKPYYKSLAKSVYDTELAQEWTEAMTSILEWLAPLAHNMIRWHSERSFEQQCAISKTNVLLVQTLYFANQEKTEAAITELLVGLNYIWRSGQELNAKALKECGSCRVFDKHLESDK